MKIGLTKFNYPEIRCVTTSQENDYINLKNIIFIIILIIYQSLRIIFIVFCLNLFL